MLVYGYSLSLAMYRIWDSKNPEVTIALADNLKECKEVIKILNEIDKGEEQK